ncbi:MAG: CpsB/CapC family capsule biosynthesis tyrosine phosphatase [Planctomycetota bacterium]
MAATGPTFTDIHCHIVPGIDDGARNVSEAVEMAAQAVADGTTTLIATPHQLGSNRHVTVAAIRQGVADLRSQLAAAGVGLSVLPGGDVRVEPELPRLLKSGNVLTLGDHGRHVLLELPHDVYVPLEPLLAALRKQGLVGILSHPERNRGIIANPSFMADVIRAGGLLQITAGSLLGHFGASCRKVAEHAVRQQFVHFVASDAHDTQRRPCGLRAAFTAVAALADERFARLLCCEHPARVAAGDAVGEGKVGKPPAAQTTRASWFRRRTA